MIRAEDLMLGDTVTVNRSECVADGGHYVTWKQEGKIILIEKEYIRVQYEVDEEYDWEEVDIKDIEPIPITPEILESNGFELKPDGWLWSSEGLEDQNYIFIQFRKGCDGVRNCEINFIHKAQCTFKQMYFVHELQHALTLFGISKTIEL